MSKPQNSCQTLLQPKISPLGPQKVKNDPKIKSKSNVRIKGNIDNESCSTTWVDPKTVFGPFPYPKKSIDRIERNKENESYSTTWVDSKTSPLRPQKEKN